MMGVIGQKRFVCILLMTLRTGLIVVQSRSVGIHLVFQLIVGPFFTRPGIIGRLVHDMTRHAGHLLCRILVGEAGRLQQPVVFAA